MNSFLRIGLIVFGILVAIAAGLYTFNRCVRKWAQGVYEDVTSKDAETCKPDDVQFADRHEG